MAITTTTGDCLMTRPKRKRMSLNQPLGRKGISGSLMMRVRVRVMTHLRRSSAGWAGTPMSLRKKSEI